MMRLFLLVAPYPWIAAPASPAASTSALVTMPEPYIAGVESILSSAIVLLIIFALHKPKSGPEPLDRKAGHPRR